jgi:hypothetical protein
MDFIRVSSVFIRGFAFCCRFGPLTEQFGAMALLAGGDDGVAD